MINTISKEAKRKILESIMLTTIAKKWNHPQKKLAEQIELLKLSELILESMSLIESEQKVHFFVKWEQIGKNWTIEEVIEYLDFCKKSTGSEFIKLQDDSEFIMAVANKMKEESKVEKQNLDTFILMKNFLNRISL